MKQRPFAASIIASVFAILALVGLSACGDEIDRAAGGIGTYRTEFTADADGIVRDQTEKTIPSGNTLVAIVLYTPKSFLGGKLAVKCPGCPKNDKEEKTGKIEKASDGSIFGKVIFHDLDQAEHQLLIETKDGRTINTQAKVLVPRDDMDLNRYDMKVTLANGNAMATKINFKIEPTTVKLKADGTFRLRFDASGATGFSDLFFVPLGPDGSRTKTRLYKIDPPRSGSIVFTLKLPPGRYVMLIQQNLATADIESYSGPFTVTGP